MPSHVVQVLFFLPHSKFFFILLSNKTPSFCLHLRPWCSSRHHSSSSGLPGWPCPCLKKAPALICHCVLNSPYLDLFIFFFQLGYSSGHSPLCSYKEGFQLLFPPDGVHMQINFADISVHYQLHSPFILAQIARKKRVCAAT